MSSSENKFEERTHNRIEYLGLIQGNISRMAGNSAIMKGFAATFMATILGMSVSETLKWYYVLIAVISLVAFIRLDIFYLQIERRYRNLYALIADQTIDDHRFALDLKSPFFERYKKEIYKNSSFFKILCSISILQFYIWFIIIAGALIIFIA